MTRAGQFVLFSPGLDEFLLTEVGTERSGLRLTVLSLFARAGRDPWEEAERLTMLPREAAIRSMTTAIATLPIPLVPHCDPVDVAARLVERLPRPSQGAWLNAEQPNVAEFIPLWMIVGVGISLAMLLLAALLPI